MNTQFLAQVGNVTNPYAILTPSITNYTNSVCGSGLFVIAANLVKLSIVIAGLYTFINFILAGYSFLSAGGDPKAISKASEKIYHSVLGLTIVAGSFILAAVFGKVIFNNSYALINPRIYTPAECGLPEPPIPPIPSSTCALVGGTCFPGMACPSYPPYVRINTDFPDCSNDTHSCCHPI